MISFPFFTPTVRTLIGRINADLSILLKKVMEMSGSFDALQHQVATNTSVIGSALALIKGFADKLAAAGTNPQALADLQAELASSDQALADAVAANTPAAPPAPTPASDPAPPAASPAAP